MKNKNTNTLRRNGHVVPLTLAAALLAAGAYSRADFMYVSYPTMNEVVKLDLGTGGVLGAFTSGLNGPEGMAFDKAGNLFVANFNDGTIMKFTPGGVSSVFAQTGSWGIYGLAFDAAGNLYAADCNFNTIEKITPGGVCSVFANTYRPWALAFDSTGDLYATGPYNNTIMRFTPDGVGSTFAHAGLAFPWGLAFDNLGNLYVGNQSGNTIEKFTVDGSPSLFAKTGLSAPQGLAIDSAGDLYAANFSTMAIEKFSPAGNDLGVFATTSAMPYFLLVQQIPEPTVWTLLCLGLPTLFALRPPKA